jgi:hypothetical protein
MDNLSYDSSDCFRIQRAAGGSRVSVVQELVACEGGKIDSVRAYVRA